MENEESYGAFAGDGTWIGKYSRVITPDGPGVVTCVHPKIAEDGGIGAALADRKVHWFSAKDLRTDRHSQNGSQKPRSKGHLSVTNRGSGVEVPGLSVTPRVRRQKSRCKACGRDFKPRRSDSYYCSSGCRQLAYRHRAKEAETTV